MTLPFFKGLFPSFTFLRKSYFNFDFFWVCLKNPKNHIWYDSVMKDHIRHDKAVRWQVTLSVTINVYIPHRLCILYRHYGPYESVSGQIGYDVPCQFIYPSL